MEDKQSATGQRFIRTFLLTIVIIIVFAYGFQVTKINLEEPKKPKRQDQLVNVMRALARPDLTLYEEDRLLIEAPILIPCPATQFTLPNLTQPGPAIELSDQCADSGSEITVTGSGFDAGENIFLFFIPYTENQDEEVELRMADEVVNADKSGNFEYTIELRKGRTSEEPQKIRAVVKRRLGWPQPSEAVYQTIEKIIETIFLALIATTLGTVLSIPISFLAARNLMIQVTSAFGGLMTLIAIAPVGWFLGSWLFNTVGGWGVNMVISGEIPAAAGLWASALLLFTVQSATHNGGASRWTGLMRGYAISFVGALVVALVWGLVAGVGQRFGLLLVDTLGPFGFLGNFLFVISDAMATFLSLIGGVTGLFIFVSLAGTITENFLRHQAQTMAGKIFTVVMSIFAGAVLFGLPAAFITWLYELNNPVSAVGIPALMGAIVVGLLGIVLNPSRSMPTGLIVYYASRTILNVLRAIEPLIMAIVFVVWVGIGPFAGVMALMLHTIAALGKLYSEQVENISQGPIEAVTATGANRLQTIIYAVIPQIVPPYIAFTIYRWDINVRMSTIIGFAGGGGIGFLLQQNLNLLKYRQASVQMIAIAIVVSTLDLISAKIRERIV